jgi:hypothetical protein
MQGTVTRASARVNNRPGWVAETSSHDSRTRYDVSSQSNNNGSRYRVLEVPDDDDDAQEHSLTTDVSDAIENRVASQRRGARGEGRRVRPVQWRDVEVVPTSTLRPEAQEFVPRSDDMPSVGPPRVGPQNLTVALDGVPIQFLCDTGAESTVLSLRCFDTLSRLARQKFQDCTSTITMPDGREAVSKGPSRQTKRLRGCFCGRHCRLRITWVGRPTCIRRNIQCCRR